MIVDKDEEEAVPLKTHLPPNHLARHFHEIRETHFRSPIVPRGRKAGKKDFAIKTTPITSLLIIQKSRVRRSSKPGPSFVVEKRCESVSWGHEKEGRGEREGGESIVRAFCSANYHFVLIL